MEKILRIPGLKPHGWYLTLVQFGIFAVLSKLELVKTGNQKTRQIPLKVYGIIALVQLGTIGFSNASLQYLNYPTQVIFKSCKLIPVLIGGILIQRKRKGMLDFVAAIVMSIGLAVFILADSQVSPNFDVIGIIMISTALVADAIIGNLQERVMKITPPPQTQNSFITAICLASSIFLYALVCQET
jgi:adenosine 3'-phospho 5'-phosphosulfate transporter B3